LRIGVTGARTLNARRLDDLRDEVHEVLALVWQHVKDLGGEAAVANFYASSDGPEAPMMRLVSPLARGADRLVAEVALHLGYALYVPMPFPRDEYKKDFTGIDATKEPDAAPLSAEQDLKEFNDLLAQARVGWVALDGDREDENRAYENVGRFVVRHSDVVIAIWNGKPAAGRGGSAEIIEYAASNGVPVWWIHATDESKPPVWIADIQDLRDCLEDAASPVNKPQELQDDMKDAGSPGSKLKIYLKGQIEPPGSTHSHSHSWLEWLARWHQDQKPPLVECYAGHPLLERGIWRPYSRCYSILMRWASGCNLPWTPPRLPDDPVAAYWFKLYEPTNERAGEYAALYRSTYVCLFFLATAAVAFGASAALLHGNRWLVLIMVLLEASTLIFIALSVAAAIRGEWHERSIEYRLLAELCRKQQVLALLGRAVSLGAVRRIVPNESETEVQGRAISSGKESANGSPDRSGWVIWLFAVWERAALLPSGDIATALPEIIEKEVLKGLIEDQLKYHRDRAEMAGRADETFFRVGDFSFRLVCCCVLVKFAAVVAGVFWPWLNEILIWNSVYAALTWLAIVLPAVSAAAFGIRSYAELQLLFEESHHMEEELTAAKRSIERMEGYIQRAHLRRAFIAEDLGTDTYMVAMLMLQDLEGWARLFRGKAIEP
jgi:hypothetical protein